jgi:hypothetical protein
MGREGLPTMNDLCEREGRKLLDNNVNVSGHHAPRRQSITFTISMQQSLLTIVAFADLASNRLP